MGFALAAAACGLVAGTLSAALPGGRAHDPSAASGWLGCPRCGRRCRPQQLMPVLALVLRRPRCGACGFPVAWRAGAMAIADAALWALVASGTAPAAEIAAGWTLATVGVLASATDLQWRRIPNRLTGAAAIAWLPLGIWSGHVPTGLEGAAAFALPLLAMALWRPVGLGMGDVKLAAVAGLYVGWPAALPALFVSMLSASVAGLAVWAFRGRRRRPAIPLGPFLALGSLAAFLAGLR